SRLSSALLFVLCTSCVRRRLTVQLSCWITDAHKADPSSAGHQEFSGYARFGVHNVRNVAHAACECMPQPAHASANLNDVALPMICVVIILRIYVQDPKSTRIAPDICRVAAPVSSHDRVRSQPCRFLASACMSL